VRHVPVPSYLIAGVHYDHTALKVISQQTRQLTDGSGLANTCMVVVVERDGQMRQQ
jgi:hypothetical protein